MELKQRLEHCKICENRIFDPKTGINCSFTQRKPKFYGNCPDFVQDLNQIKKIESDNVKKQLSYSFPKGAVVAYFLAIAFTAAKLFIKSFW